MVALVIAVLLALHGLLHALGLAATCVLSGFVFLPGFDLR